MVWSLSFQTKKCFDVAILLKKQNIQGMNNGKLAMSARPIMQSPQAQCLGAVAIFQRSIENYNLRYTEYVGVGDSSSFQDAEVAKPYGNICIKILSVWDMYKSELVLVVVTLESL